jgi:hypothetical protein
VGPLLLALSAIGAVQVSTHQVILLAAEPYEQQQLAEVMERFAAASDSTAEQIALDLGLRIVREPGVTFLFHPRAISLEQRQKFNEVLSAIEEALKSSNLQSAQLSKLPTPLANAIRQRLVFSYSDPSFASADCYVGITAGINVTLSSVGKSITVPFHFGGGSVEPTDFDTNSPKLVAPDTPVGAWSRVTVPSPIYLYHRYPKHAETVLRQNNRAFELAAQICEQERTTSRALESRVWNALLAAQSPGTTRSFDSWDSLDVGLRQDLERFVATNPFLFDFSSTEKARAFFERPKVENTQRLLSFVVRLRNKDTKVVRGGQYVIHLDGN